MFHNQSARLTALLATVLVFASDVSIQPAAANGAHGSGGAHFIAPAGRGFGGDFRGGFGGCGRYGGFGRYGGYGWYGPGFGLGLGLGYGYGWGWGYPYYAYPYGYGYGYPVYVDTGIPGPLAAAPPGTAAVQQAAHTAPGAPPDGPVRLTDSDVLLSIRVPSEAVVEINGAKTTQSGPRREFVSSGLSPGRTYTFSLTAHWTGANGKPVERRRRIAVQGGERRNVDFTIPVQ
jgi:uncharacterized protein (TIGR03000 family)